MASFHHFYFQYAGRSAYFSSDASVTGSPKNVAFTPDDELTIQAPVECLCFDHWLWLQSFGNEVQHMGQRN